jgi:hypothetical protein
MNEPKKRGRPAKVRVDLTAEAMSGITGDEFERPPFVSEPSVFTQGKPKPTPTASGPANPPM